MKIYALLLPIAAIFILFNVWPAPIKIIKRRALQNYILISDGFK